MESGVLVVVDHQQEVVGGQGTFASGCSTSHSHAALKGTTDEDRVPGLFDGRELGFELLGDAR